LLRAASIIAFNMLTIGPRVLEGIRRNARIKSASHFSAPTRAARDDAPRAPPAFWQRSNNPNNRNVTGLGRTGEFSRTIWLNALGVMASCRAASACDHPEARSNSRNSCFKSIPAI
jgi:hypothetical protein